MIDQGDVRQFYTEESAYRARSLQIAAECARMSVPSVLPTSSGSEYDTELADIGGIQPSLQSIGARGATSIASGLALTFAPPGQMWFASQPGPETESRLQAAPDQWYTAHAQLKAQDILAHGHIEAAHSGGGKPYYHAGFLSRVYTAMLQLVVTGDVLILLDDDMRQRVFRRDRYVTVRDADGFPLCHVTLEWVDPMALSDDDLASIKMDRQRLNGRRYRDRKVKKYTACCWDHQKNRWAIWSEIDGHVVGGQVAYEKYSPYISVAFSLNSEDNYGHGIIEQNLADLTSLESMESSRLNILANAGRLLMAMDIGCNADPQTLADTPTGGFVANLRVEGGQVQDVAPLNVADMRDFAMLTEGVRDKREDIGRDLMIETEMQPEKDRVTATQINRIAQEVQGRWGPMLIPLADAYQRPLAARYLYLLHKKNKISIPGMIVPFQDQQQIPRTGVDRLFNDQKLQRVTQFVQTMSLLGPEAAQRLNVQNLVETMKHLYELDDVPGLTRSEDEIQEQQRQQAATEAEAQIAVQEATAQ